MVEDMGVATGVDLEAMIAAAAEAERIVGRTLSSQVLRAGPRRAPSALSRAHDASHKGQHGESPRDGRCKRCLS